MDSGATAAGTNGGGSDSDSEVKFDEREVDNDSEHTLDEEEALHGHDNEEIDDLQKESEMPLEMLLQRYGYAAAGGSDEEAARGPTGSSSRRKRVRREVHSNAAKRSKTDAGEPGKENEKNADKEKEHEKHVDDEHRTAEEEEAESESFDGEQYSDSESDSDNEDYERYDVAELLNRDESIEDEEDGAEYDPDADESNVPFWKRDIRVGEEFQATLPDCSAEKQPDGSEKDEETCKQIANEIEIPTDRLDFRPCKLDETAIERFMISFYKLLRRRRELTGDNVIETESRNGVLPDAAKEKDDESAFERTSAAKDDEHALRTLCDCDFDPDRALRTLEQELAASRSSASVASTGVTDADSKVRIAAQFECGDDCINFDAEECARFEAGLRYFGKDFFQIRRVYFSGEQPKDAGNSDVPTSSVLHASSDATQSDEPRVTADLAAASGPAAGSSGAVERRGAGCIRERSVRELVHFYYVWKKTERRDAFVHRYPFDKKRYAAVRPGVSDYLDRLFDEEPVDAAVDPDAEADPDADSHPAAANGVAHQQPLVNDERPQNSVDSANLTE